MLSKSHAKKFFLGGTVGFSAIFLWLTVDTLMRVPARSHEDKLDAHVLSGRLIWDKHNCMGCHTILGEGAYYAPELTKVVERRGKDWIRMFLRNPEAMFPNERKMVNYHFDQHPEQIDDLVAFLDWIGHVDTNGFPAKPDLAAKPPSNVAVAPANGAASGKLASAPAIFKELCMGCHSLEGQGAAVGPALDNLSARYTPEAFDKWVSNPNSVKPGTAMPNFSLSPEVRKELASFLLSNGGAR